MKGDGTRVTQLVPAVTAGSVLIVPSAVSRLTTRTLGTQTLRTQTGTGAPGLVPRDGLRLTEMGEPVSRSRAQLVLDVLPFLIMAAAAVAAVDAGPPAPLPTPPSLGPAFAAVSSGLRQTTLIGAVALALCALIAWSQNTGGLGQDFLLYDPIP